MYLVIESDHRSDAIVHGPFVEYGGAIEYKTLLKQRHKNGIGEMATCKSLRIDICMPIKPIVVEGDGVSASNNLQSIRCYEIEEITVSEGGAA